MWRHGLPCVDANSSFFCFVYQLLELQSRKILVVGRKNANCLRSFKDETRSAKQCVAAMRQNSGWPQVDGRSKSPFPIPILFCNGIESDAGLRRKRQTHKSTGWAQLQKKTEILVAKVSVVKVTANSVVVVVESHTMPTAS